MASPDSIYTPSEWQSTYHNLPHREALGAGSAGPGKTRCLFWDPLFQIVAEHQRCTDPNHPYPIDIGDSVGWALFLRRETPMLEPIIAYSHRVIKKIDPKAEWTASTNTWRFTSGYRYQFGHCAEGASFEKYMGHEYTWIGFDELRQFEDFQYENIGGRNRTNDPVLRPMLKIRAMSNPSDPDGQKVRKPNWVRDHFVEDAREGKVTLERIVKMHDGTEEVWQRIYLPATLYDNPDKEFVRDYERTLRTRPVHIQRALLYGDWYTVPGSFFGEDWDASVHVSEPFRVPTTWRHFRSMDWGFKSHGVVLWWAQDPDGTWFVHRELSFRGWHPDKVAKEVIRAEEEMGLARNGKSLITGPADTQLWEERGDRGLSKAQEFQKHGVRWVKANKAPGSIKRNSERLLLLLRDHKEDGVPGIVFFKGCRMSIRTICEVLPDKDDPEMPDQDYKDDHWLDTVRYGVEYAERIGARALSPSEVDEDRVFAEERPDDEARGQYGYG
jgi:hypothetical protein